MFVGGSMDVDVLLRGVGDDGDVCEVLCEVREYVNLLE